MLPLFCLALFTSLEGQVTDALTGERLANVRLELPDGTATTTNREGTFRLNAEPGLTLRVTLVGYRPERILLTEAPSLEIRTCSPCSALRF